MRLVSNEELREEKRSTVELAEMLVQNASALEAGDFEVYCAALRNAMRKVVIRT